MLACVPRCSLTTPDRSLKAHPAVIAGWLVLALVVATYGGIIVAAWLRVGRQYSRAMAGSGSMRMAAILDAIGRHWYLMLVVVVGALMVLLGR